ncbi:MAG: PIG-L deacetylase family protein [Candidatus Methylomirabilales bacterium]
MDPKDVEFSKALVFCAHPDDGEFSCGGSMARWGGEGKEVILCVVTNGAAGSNDPSVVREELVALREREQRQAAEIVGVKEVIFLGYEDGYVEDSHGLRRDMVREIRRHKPDVVVGPDPTSFYFEQRYVNHPDHRAVGLAFLAAVNPGATTVPLYRAELYDQGFHPHQVKACLLTSTREPDYFVDIEGFLETKIRALRAHASQMGTWDELGEMIRGMAGTVGERSGGSCRYAEGFRAFFFVHETG